MKKQYFLLIINLICYSYCAIAQPKQSHLEDLKNQVTLYNDKQEYENSINLIHSFLQNKNATAYDYYFALVLKSHTHKRLFNYPQALVYLDSAYTYGIKSDRKQEVIACIKAEKSFVYFDTRNYAVSSKIMKELKSSNFKYISDENRPVIIMQLGYIAYLDHDYRNAEILYDEAIALMSTSIERNLPMIYGKKVKLYGKMNLPEKRNIAFNLGVKTADKFKILKYKLYMYEMLFQQFGENEDYRNAYFAGSKFDSIKNLYNAEQESTNVEITEQKFTLFSQDAKLKQQRYLLWFLAAFVLCLALIIWLIYYLLRAKKKTHQLLEIEYKRITDELYVMTQGETDKRDVINDLSKFNLTARQHTVINMLKDGKSNKEIADELSITANTVKYHLKTIYDILKVEKRKDFIR